MHDAAKAFVIRAIEELHVDPDGAVVAELGSYNVNGSVRDLFEGCKSYTGVDVRKGPGVDVVEDGGTWGRANSCDVVVSTETLEHAPDPAAIIANAGRILKPGGVVIVTAAGPDRPPHGGDGGAVGDEHYGNIDPGDLRRWLHAAGFRGVHVERNPVQYHDDVYAYATLPDGDA